MPPVPACYSDWALRELPAWARRHFRTDGAKRHAVAERIRKMVAFAPLNLAMDPFPGALDVIVCRNVLMYLTDDVRAATIQRLGRALSETGLAGVEPARLHARRSRGTCSSRGTRSASGC